MRTKTCVSREPSAGGPDSPPVRFYAVAPLITAPGLKGWGRLCVNAFFVHRQLQPEQLGRCASLRAGDVARSAELQAMSDPITRLVQSPPDQRKDCTRSPGARAERRGGSVGVMAIDGDISRGSTTAGPRVGAFA